MSKIPAFIAFLLFLLQDLSGQEISGRIIDSQSGRSLAFVNIVFNETGQGTVSNIDGDFTIPSTSRIEFLKFSYLGYRTRHLALNEIKEDKKILIRLERTSYRIEEVKVLPGINPAHRIINLALDNRDMNNPEKMRSFAYTSYSKMYFTMLVDSMFPGEDVTEKGTEIQTENSIDPPDLSDSPDTVMAGDSLESQPEREKKNDLQEMKDFLEEKHLFLMEFVSDREFIYPDKNREVVTASRVSGFKDPSFTFLATQMQSFSFYDDLIMIWDKKYLNPISRGSTRKYLFVLEDTMYTENDDSLFVISFRPLRGKNFDGLKGILHINSRQYAIQNVIAEAAEDQDMFSIRIQQKYDLIDDKQWFPVELNTDIILSPKNARVNNYPIRLAGIGKSYLSDIDLEPALQKKSFNHIALRVDEDAHKRSDEFWDQYRVQPLTAKDSNTYEFIDSIGEEANFDRSLNILETLASGYIPWKFLNIDYRSLINWNQYEGFRFGIAAETNSRISNCFSLGGKFAYGIRDRGFKYGGQLKFYLNNRKDAWLRFSYDYDVVESAGIQYVEKPPITSSEFFRSFLISNMDILEEKAVSLDFPALRYFRIQTSLSQNQRQVTTDYRFMGEDLFQYTQAGLKLKYAFKEKFIETPRGNRLSLGTNYPVLYLNISAGIPLLGGEYEYLKTEAKITKTFISKTIGDTKLALTGGFADRNLPYPFLYAGTGSYGTFTIESENSFATMRLNEFVADRYASFHFQQDFGKLIFKSGKFQPGIVLATSAGYGELFYNQNHLNLNASAYDKGYFESGILFNNLLNQSFIGYGLGVFYRYGSYAYVKTNDNFAFKFTIRFNL